MTTPDDLVAAARRATHSRTVQVVRLPDGGADRVYLPSYGRHFDVPAGTWPLAGTELVALAEALLASGAAEQAGAAADHALTLELPGQVRDRARLVHIGGHGQRCCTAHATHVTPHRGCLLR